MKPIRFILLSTQRSGSTALRLVINNLTNINCHDEVLLKEPGSRDIIAAYVKRKNIEKQYERKDYHGNSRKRKELLYNHEKGGDRLVHAYNKFTDELPKSILPTCLPMKINLHHGQALTLEQTTY